MSAEPLPAPPAPAARSRRTESLTRSVLGRSGRPVLSLVATPERAKRAPFVALVLGILLAGLVGLLLLTTASAQDAFRLHRLQASAANVADNRQALSDQVNTLTGPGALADQAQHMGMVPMGPPVFWKPGTPLPPGARVVDGMVVVPAPGAAKPAPAPTPSVPTGAAGASVTSVARPGQQASTSTSPSTKASTSTGASGRTSPSSTASGGTGTSKATTGTTPATRKTPTTGKATTTGKTATTGKTTGKATTGRTTTTQPTR